MDKQTQESYDKLIKKLAEKHSEILENYHAWQNKEITTSTHDYNSDILFTEKRKIYADIGALFKDDVHERFKP
jgi:hypothetical protein